MDNQIEPWLRGAPPGVHPSLAPTLFALLQVREDLALHTTGLSDAQVWARPHGLAPLGFHLKHIAGSLDRLTTYLEDRPLDDRQMQFLRTELTPDGRLAELLAGVESALQHAEAAVRAVNPDVLGHFRGVGRKRLPTTVIGLVVHLAEHTQRHLGQAIAAAKLARATAP